MTDRITRADYHRLTATGDTTLAEIAHAARKQATASTTASVEPQKRATARRGRNNKYHAQKVADADGVFDSKLEHSRWQELKLLRAAGQIAELERQIEYVLELNGHRLCKFTADFRYRDLSSGELITEDAKGILTREIGLKIRLMKALHGIDVRLWPERKRKARKRKNG